MIGSRLVRSLYQRFVCFGSFCRVALARASGAQIGSRCRVGPHVCLRLGWENFRRGGLVIGVDCEISKGVCLHPFTGSILIANHVFIGPNVVVYGHGGVEIGDHSLIAMHCCILSSNHTIPPCGTLIRSQPDILLPTKIGRDVWLGAGVKVLGGVTIGDGCIVGAGAVVTRDLPAYSLAVGIPARITGMRETL